MALHAARFIRLRHKADNSLLETSLSPEKRKVLEEAFGAADTNGDGILSADEYLRIFQSHGLSIDCKWIERTIAKNDKDGDGGISLEEFIEMNLRNRRHPSGSPLSREPSVTERARLAFNVYDRNRDGFLTKAELRKTSKRMTPAQINAVFEKYDHNKDGKLDFEEFKQLMEANAKDKCEQVSSPATRAN